MQDVVQTWRVKPFVCVCVWKWEPVSIGVWVSIVQEVSWEGSSSRFTLRLSSVNHSRRLEDIKGRRVRVFSSCRHPQGGESANFRGDVRIDFHFRADFIWVFRICKIAFGIRDAILSLMQRPFFLPHTWAKLWMRCYLFTPCWTERCALFICSDRRDSSRVGHRPGKTLKRRAQSNEHVARDLSSHAHANTIIDFLSISLFFQPALAKKMVHSRKTSQNDFQDECFFWEYWSCVCAAARRSVGLIYSLCYEWIRKTDRASEAN